MASTTTLNENNRTVDYSEYIRLATPGNNWKVQLSDIIRSKASGTINYYVRPDGSDSNDGSSNTAGSAFLTLQHAYDVITRNVDTGGQTIEVNVAAGTYAPLNLDKPWTGGGIVEFVGDEVTPSNVVIDNSTAGINCLNCQASLPALFTFTGFRLTNSNGSGIFHTGSGIIQVGALSLGACSIAHYYLNGEAAQIQTYLPQTVNGAALFHVANQAPAYFFQGASTTLSGTLAFNTFVAASHLSYSGFGGGYTGGTISGFRYQLDTNSVINTAGGGTNFFPGTSSGLISTGGQYI